MMTNWLDYLVDARPVTAIFGSTVPSLDGLSLMTMTLNREGPSVTLDFDLVEYPENPPAKWQRAKANQVHLSLLAGGVGNLRIEGFGLEVPFALAIDKVRSRLDVRLTGPTMNARLSADFLFVQKISAYQKG